MIGALNAQRQTLSELESLPAELLTEVLKMLTWKDVLRLRATCKLLAEATKIRAVWAHLVMEHISSAAYPPRLERPIDMYTSEEIENALLLWKSVDIGWQRDDKRPARERVFAANQRRCQILHLVKGGRWLLATSHQTGSVTYYDLDAETIVGIPLIPDQIPSCGSRNAHIAIDFHDETPMLSFTIALSLADRSEAIQSLGRHSYETVQIWKVSLVLNKSNQGVGLEAKQLACFPHRPVINTVMAISLLGSAIAFCAYPYPIGNRSAYIYVVDWIHANRNPTMYAWRLVASETRAAQLLPNSRLLIFDFDDTVSLLDYSTTAETTSMMPRDENSPWIDYAWTVNVAGFDPRASSLRILSSGSAQLVFIASDILYSMTIDGTSLSPATQPPILTLMDTSFLDCARPPALGCNRAIYINRQHDAFLMRYALPNADGISGGASYIQKHISPDFSPPFIWDQIIDEDCGRVVIPGNTTITVIDFALVFR